MSKNILMTTLSFLKNKNALNYYYYENSSHFIFCDGISSLEAGSKYILSTQAIDGIVVIGSDKTFHATDTLIVDDILQLQPQDSDSIASMSHYEFYKMRIASFLQNVSYSDELAAISSLPKTETSITSDRKKEIKNLVIESIKAILPTNCNIDINTHINQLLHTSNIPNDTSNNPNKILSEIEKVMKQKLTLDINRSFESSNAYERYITVKQELAQKYTEIPLNDQNPLTILREQREKIDKDTSLSSLERQYLLISLKEKVNQMISERTMLSYQETINDLYLEIDRLNYKLNLIKSHRQAVETQYAKYVIFSLFDKNHRLMPKQENTTHAMPIRFVKEADEKKRDNLLEIVNSLYDNSGEPIHLYIDMQGGERTSGYVRNAVLSILTNQTTNPVSIEKIVATKFEHLWFNEIVEETSRYKIIDLASGMNAFIRYGKADIIQSYCEAVGIPTYSPFRKLVNCMIQIDDAISLCDMAELTQAIKNLQVFFSSQENMDYNDEFSNIYQVLLDGIRLDYGKLLDNSEELNLIELIKWSLKKGFIQQALTLIEDKMPSYYFNKNWISYDLAPEHTTDFLNVLEPSYEHRIENKLFYSFTNKVKAKKEKADIRNKFNELWWYYKTNGKNEYEPIKSITDFENNLSEGNYSYILNSNLKEVVEETFHKLCSLPQEQFSTKLPFLYCKFRSMEHYLENHKGPSTKKTSELLFSYTPETFYYIMEQNDQFKYKKPSISFTILSYLGKDTYPFKYKNKTFDVDLELKLHPALEKRQENLEELFLLHHALKKERNCNNHASEKGLRLPKKVVTNAIQVYLDKIQEIETFLTNKN